MRHRFVTVWVCLLLSAAALQAQQWEETSLADIRPEGWLLQFLQTQRDGLTGHPEALSYPYNTGLWNGDIPRMGTHGRVWWRYEQTAYYTDGLLRLGYLLQDSTLVDKALQGIEYTLTHPKADGWLGNRDEDNSWPMAVFFRALKAQYDVSGDPRIPSALAGHYAALDLRHLAHKRNIVSLEGMLWLYGLTGEPSLLAKSDSVFLHRSSLVPEDPPVRDSRVTLEFLTGDKPYDMHGVTMCEILKLPVMLYQATGNPYYRHLAVTCLDRIFEENGLPDGLFTCAEWLKGRGIMNSHETCDAIDMSWTLGYFLEILQEARYADMLEKIVFNAGLGAITNDFKALQYYSSVNQFICTGTSNHNVDNYGSTWMAYRPTHQTECCAGQIHRLMPNYASRMWLRSSDGVVAALYGPSTLRYNDSVSLVEETEYPYDQTVTFRVKATEKERFTLRLRIPLWCHGASLKVNGKSVKSQLEPGTFYALERTFKDGDRIVLELPMQACRQTAFGGGIYFERGPLVYSYPIPAKWEKDTVRYANMNGKYPADDNAFPCWSITPSGPWAFAVSADASPQAISGPDGPRLRIPVRPIDWPLFETPDGKQMTPALPQIPAPVGPVQYIDLVPYGSTTLRLTVFPVLYY